MNKEDYLMVNKWVCPNCKAIMKEMNKALECNNKDCGFFISYKIKGKKLTENQKLDLINKGRTKVIRGFKGENGKYDAILELIDGAVVFRYIVYEVSPYRCPKCGKKLTIKTSAAMCNNEEGCGYRLCHFCSKHLTVIQIEKLLAGKVVKAYGFKSMFDDSKFNAKIQLITDKNDPRCGRIKIIEYI